MVVSTSYILWAFYKIAIFSKRLLFADAIILGLMLVTQNLLDKLLF